MQEATESPRAAVQYPTPLSRHVLSTLSTLSTILYVSSGASSPTPSERQSPAALVPRTSTARPPAHRRPRNRYAAMMVQALLLLPRLVVTPPNRLVVVPSHRAAAVRRFTAPGMQLGEHGGVENIVSPTAGVVHEPVD